MLTFLQSHFTLVIGAALAVLAIAIRALVKERDLRRDLRGALLLLFLFLIFRVFAPVLTPYLPSGGARALAVAWMITFAFGVIRFAVAIVLWIYRLRSKIPTPKILRDVIDFSLYAMAAIPILRAQLEIDLTGLLATSAILSVVLGLALQDTLGNLFAGLSIQVERPYQVGDVVTIGEHSGRVVQIAWRATRLETFRHEYITIPNNVCAKEAVKNFTRGTDPVGRDIFLRLSVHTPPNQVKEAVSAVFREVPLVLTTPEPKVRTWAFEEGTVRYQLRFFVADYLDADTALEEINTRLWYRFRREGIELPAVQHHVQLSQPGQRRELEEETILRLLESVDIFGVLSPEELQRLAPAMHPRRFGRGERILDAGAAGHTFYLVASGEVEIRAGRPETEIARLGRGQYFGEMSLLTGEPRAASVVAASDTVLLELDRPVFARLFSENANLARQLSAVLAQRRGALRQASESPVPASHAPEANRIFAKLRSIFGLED